MYTESKPEHLKLFLALKNIYLKDFNTPQPSLPYIIQTVIPERVAPFDSYHYGTHE
jgi:preprotein translocase subunit SecB